MLYLNVRKSNQLYLVRFASHFIIDMSTPQVSGKDLNKLAYIPEAEEGPSTHYFMQKAACTVAAGQGRDPKSFSTSRPFILPFGKQVGMGTHQCPARKAELLLRSMWSHGRTHNRTGV